MLIFKAKLKLESGNQKIQYGRQAAILKVTTLKINRLLPMATINMHMKFEIEIPKQTWLMLRKPCRLQTDGRTDRRTRWIQYTPPPSNFVGRGYNNFKISFFLWYLTGWTPFHWMKLPRAMRMPRHHNWHRLIHCNPLSKEWWDDPWGSPCNYLADRDRDLRKSAM